MRPLIALCLLAAIAAQAQTFQLPTDADLKSAYCIPVKKAMIEAYAKITDVPSGKKAYNDANTDLIRLQSYIVPRVSSLDPTSIVLATKRGESDYKQAMADAGQCASRCSAFVENGGPTQRWNECSSACVAESTASARIRSCNNLSWLPF